MFEGRSLSLLRKARFLQDLYLKMACAVHPSISHNIEKIEAIKKAMFAVDLDQLDGDYLEFGVFDGTSFIAAYKCWQTTRYKDSPERAFYGFDSFNGFKYFDPSDAHPVWTEGAFASDYADVSQRVGRAIKKARWKLIPGYLETSLASKKPSDFGIEHVSVALLDLDLGGPTKIALDFMRPALQRGTILLFDDYFAYRGDPTKGEAGAFNQFQAENPALEFVHFRDFGIFGRSFIVSVA
jgi:hypothetical protein